MQKKLYVGGLSWDTTSEGLERAFAVHGDVEEALVITEPGSGRSRGFGFVTFATEEQSESALSLDGSELDGRTIRVSVAREKQKRTDRW